MEHEAGLTIIKTWLTEVNKINQLGSRLILLVDDAFSHLSGCDSYEHCKSESILQIYYSSLLSLVGYPNKRSNCSVHFDDISIYIQSVT